LFIARNVKLLYFWDLVIVINRFQIEDKIKETASNLWHFIS